MHAGEELRDVLAEAGEDDAVVEAEFAGEVLEGGFGAADEEEFCLGRAFEDMGGGVEEDGDAFALAAESAGDADDEVIGKGARSRPSWMRAIFCLGIQAARRTARAAAETAMKRVVRRRRKNAPRTGLRLCLVRTTFTRGTRMWASMARRWSRPPWGWRTW